VQLPVTCPIAVPFPAGSNFFSTLGFYPMAGVI
jgi:hypothetical protein